MNKTETVLTDEEIDNIAAGFSTWMFPVETQNRDCQRAIVRAAIEAVLAKLAEKQKQETVAVHWRAVLDPAQVPQQLQESMHVAGFRKEKAAQQFIAEQADFYGWRYTLEPLYTHPPTTPALVEAAEKALEFITNPQWGTWAYMESPAIYEDAGVLEKQLLAALQGSEAHKKGGAA